MPEPDVAIYKAEQLHGDPHPTEAVLLVEVSDSSLAIDRSKAFEYAAAKVPEFWILDVNKLELVVHRDPVADPMAGLGFRYPSMKTFDVRSVVSPLAKPSVDVLVGEFFKGF